MRLFDTLIKTLLTIAIIALTSVYYYHAIRWSDADYCINHKVAKKCHTFFFNINKINH